MRKNKILMFAAATMLLASCGGGGGRPSFGDNEYPVATVGTSSTTMQSTYPATIKGVQDVEIHPKVQGFITQINVYSSCWIMSPIRLRFVRLRHL